MKSVLISIQPQWCVLIASGKKTLEVRKTRPKLETPFKVYIYCTADTVKHIVFDEYGDRQIELVPQRVIGEFICDTFVIDKTFGHDALFNGAACMTEIECAVYSCRSPIYGWHISNLKIYDTPLDLSNFFHACDKPSESNCSVCEESGKACCKQLRRAPQSWCYVMEEV